MAAIAYIKYALLFTQVLTCVSLFLSKKYWFLQIFLPYAHNVKLKMIIDYSQSLSAVTNVI